MIFKNSKLLLVLLILILAGLVVTVAFLVYENKVTNQETSQLLNEADSITEARNLSQSILIAQNKAKADLADFDNLVLTSNKLVFLIEDIEKTGRALGLETNIVSVGKMEEKKPAEPDVVRIVLETQGSWASTLSFLRAIENLPHRVMIEEMNLSKDDSSWHLKIVLSLYSFN